MKDRTISSQLLLIPFFLSILLPSFAQNTDVMMQGFNWESHSNTAGWYNVVQNNAAAIGNAGIDMLWMPPPSDAGAPQGYLPRELYDVSTNYGSQSQLVSCINALHSNGVKALADIVVNHRVGTTNWADFTYPTWGCWAVVSNDEWGSNGGNPCGAYDTGQNYSAARDLDHTNSTVRNDISAWMNWLKNSIGFDGWRYDYVRGFSGYYTGLYNDATAPYFSVGELWDNLDLNNVNPHRQQIIDWIDDTQGKSHAFDFTTKGVLQQAVNGELWRLNINGGAPGVIGWYPARAVTFLDNHDTGSTQNYWPFPGGKVMQGYAYILTHPGVPCVFWDHFFDWGLQSEISALIDIRKRNGIHSTSSLSIKAAQGNLYAAEVDGKVAMKIGPGNWSPSGSDWNLVASGNNYAVWEKGGGSNCNGGLTLHFKNSNGWGAPSIYFWNPTPAGASTSWPGEPMQNDGNGWYSYSIPCANCAHVIFSNNGASQTADLYRCEEGWYKDGVWSNSNPEGGGSVDLTIRFKPNSYSNPKIYFWNVSPSGPSTTWPGLNMTPDGNGWYKYTFAGANCANFIFSNNGGNQSPDLNSCVDADYTEGNYKAGELSEAVAPAMAVSVSPVPADDRLRFELSDALQSPAWVDIYDMNGRRINSKVVRGSFQLDTRSFSNGIYCYRFRQGDAVIHGKFQVLH